MLRIHVHVLKTVERNTAERVYILHVCRVIIRACTSRLSNAESRRYPYGTFKGRDGRSRNSHIIAGETLCTRVLEFATFNEPALRIVPEEQNRDYII